MGLVSDAGVILTGLRSFQSESGRTFRVAGVLVTVRKIGFESLSFHPFAFEQSFSVIHHPGEFLGVQSIGRAIRTGQFHGVRRNGDFVIDRRAKGFARQFDQLDQVVQVALVNVSGQTIPLDADRGGSPHDLTHHSAGLHDPHGSESLVGHAYATARHEEVLDIAGVKTAVRYGVTIGSIHALAVHGVGNKGVVGKLLGILFFGIM